MRMGNVMGYQGGGGECYEVSGRGRGDVMGYQDGGWGMLWGMGGGINVYQGGGINGYQGGAGEWGTKVGNREWNGELEVGLLLPRLGARYRCRRT